MEDGNIDTQLLKHSSDAIYDTEPEVVLSWDKFNIKRFTLVNYKCSIF